MVSVLACSGRLCFAIAYHGRTANLARDSPCYAIAKYSPPHFGSGDLKMRASRVRIIQLYNKFLLSRYQQRMRDR